MFILSLLQLSILSQETPLFVGTQPHLFPEGAVVRKQADASPWAYIPLLTIARESDKNTCVAIALTLHLSAQGPRCRVKTRVTFDPPSELWR